MWWDGTHNCFSVVLFFLQLCTEEATKILRSDAMASTTARTIYEWIDRGIRSALAEGYVRKIIFGIAAEPNCIDILEEYSFKFEKDDRETLTTPNPADEAKSKGSSENGSHTVRNIKRQIIGLLRHLLGITRTLEPVPDEFSIFIKLQYREDTPESYEPPCFEPANGRAVGFFSTKPYGV